MKLSRKRPNFEKPSRDRGQQPRTLYSSLELVTNSKFKSFKANEICKRRIQSNDFEFKFKIKLKLILIYKTISFRAVLAILYVGK